jgi:hypothetical protein
MSMKPIPVEVDTFYHLVPIINLVRKAIVAERTLRDLEAVRRLYQNVDQILAVTGINVLDDETMLDDAAHALSFVAQVLCSAHENDMEGGTDGT